MSTCLKGNKVLVVFDFDSTLVDANSDTIFTEVLAPDLMPMYGKLVLSDGLSWVATVNAMLRRLHELGHGAEAIRGSLGRVPIAAGMRRVVDLIAASEGRLEAIVVSDSNELFIDWILSALAIPASLFRRIYTNAASVSPEGLITVVGFHNHHATPHSCHRLEPRCPERLCKTAALSEYLDEFSSSPYRTKIYLGDGKGDACPCLSPLFGPEDSVLARRGWALAKFLSSASPSELRARLLLWDTDDIFDQFSHALSLSSSSL